MPPVDSVIFQRNPEAFLYEAQRGPVEITRQGRRACVLMSANHYDWLRAAADVVIDAVERAEMNAGFTPLDTLLG